MWFIEKAKGANEKKKKKEMLSTPYFCKFSVIMLMFRCLVFAKFASYNFAQKRCLGRFLLNV